LPLTFVDHNPGSQSQNDHQDRTGLTHGLDDLRVKPRTLHDIGGFFSPAGVGPGMQINHPAAPLKKYLI
jgi:hypothetical protein